MPLGERRPTPGFLRHVAALSSGINQWVVARGLVPWKGMVLLAVPLPTPENWREGATKEQQHMLFVGL